MNNVTTEELHERLGAGPVALFDVRGDIEYELGHIPGALTAPLGSLVFRVARVMNPDSYVAVYSTGRDGLDAEAVERLENLGMTNIHIYRPGTEGWQAAGFPIVPSVDPKVVARGPVIECRPLVVDRENAYGGAFRGKPVDVEGAGG